MVGWIILAVVLLLAAPVSAVIAVIAQAGTAASCGNWTRG